MSRLGILRKTRCQHPLWAKIWSHCIQRPSGCSRMQQDAAGWDWIELVAWWPDGLCFGKFHPQSSGSVWIEWTTHRPKNSQAKRVPSCWIVLYIYHCFHPQMLLWHSCPRKMISPRICWWTLYCCFKFQSSTKVCCLNPREQKLHVLLETPICQMLKVHSPAVIPYFFP